MRVVQGDLFEAFRLGVVDAIAHCVNCKGVMGSGVALQMKEIYPEVYRVYKDFVQDCISEGYVPLGESLEVHTQHGVVYNLFGQEYYGRDQRHLDYGALADSLIGMSVDLPEGTTVGFPYKIGCDRAGGNWEVVQEIIFHFLEREGINVVFYQL
jgi:O-acetyl-ADP-ribose deacetylase (regulator of RNase III)